MERGQRRQPSRRPHGAEDLAELRVPAELDLTPSQMTGLVAIAYGSGEAVADERVETALRRMRGRADRSEESHVARLATTILTAGFAALLSEGSVSIEMGRQRKLGLIPVARVMIAKRDATSFPSGSLEQELHHQVTSEPQRAYELYTTWLSKTARPAEHVINFAITSIAAPTVDGKLQEARPHLPLWCERLAAFLVTDLGRELRVDASSAMVSRLPKGPSNTDLSWLPGQIQD